MTERLIMNNVKEKLSKIREYCVGMSEDVYAITDHMADIAEESFTPEGLVSCLLAAKENIKNQRNGLSPEGIAMSRYLRDNKYRVLKSIIYIPQVIDEIAESEFAEEFRRICNEEYGFNPPKRFYEKLDEIYPKYVRVAVDWWCNEMFWKRFKNTGTYLNSIMIDTSDSKQYSAEEIKLFKNSLADEIFKHMQEYSSCNIEVDFFPCSLLAKAGEKIGISPQIGYPWKTYMMISSDGVYASSRQEGYKTLWTNHK